MDKELETMFRLISHARSLGRAEFDAFVKNSVGRRIEDAVKERYGVDIDEAKRQAAMIRAGFPVRRKQALVRTLGELWIDIESTPAQEYDIEAADSVM